MSAHVIKNISVVQHLGTREYQEDRIDVRKLKHYQFTILTLCDGHGGSQCVDFVIKRFPKYVADSLSDKLAETNRPNIQRLLKKCIAQIVDEWDTHSLGPSHAIVDDTTRVQHFRNIDMQQYLMSGKDSGTTLVCCVIDEERAKAHIVNLGDSRCCIHIESGKPIFATVDHAVPESAPTSTGKFKLEYKDGRVANDLAMTSSIGDNTHDLVGQILRKPDTHSVALVKGSRILLASDGLFDVCSTQKCFLNNRKTAEELVALDVHKTLDDNTTVIMYDYVAAEK
jgi:serine/threonine protein phosphatase PrpC